MTKKINIVDCPEEITPDGLKIYGEVSYESHIALLSHYLHNIKGNGLEKRIEKEDIINAIHEYIEYKRGLPLI